MAVLRQILGWKWDNLEELAHSESLCQKFFQLPLKAEGQVTVKCLGPIPNYNMRGNIDFYYIAYSQPDQFKPVLGDPILFDITYLNEEDELQK